MFHLSFPAEGFVELYAGDRLVLRHSPETPALFLGFGREEIRMYRGNFTVRDREDARLPLRFLGAEGECLRFAHPDLCGEYTLRVTEADGLLRLTGSCDDARVNRLWLRLCAEADEHVTGGGEQFSALDLRGRNYPIWTREQGVGRNKLTEVTRLADATDGGGDYHTTFFPQPTFVSSRMYFVHLENYEYSELDFREKDCHEITLWTPALQLDWEGKRVTSFGKRLQWDWRWNRELYPELDKVIAADDSAWMGYINPYLVEGGVLFQKAQEKGYFVRNAEGADYLFDFGEFNCGVVDLSMPAAFDWYKSVIRENLIGMGFKGWMADFGEYLPADAVCFGGSGMELHNAWPMLWAKCNREAVEEAGVLGDCVFFMRSGAAGSQKYSTLLSGGDQCVDWSEDDGLPSAVTAALTAGMSGYGLHCSDIGGYTTLFHLKRDAELLLRWTEFAAFTPVMRSHEGNRPDSNVQLYDTPELIAAAARLVRIHDRLLPYLKACVQENEEKGLPVMRPLFLASPDEKRAYARENYSYLLGGDLLVAPVVEPRTESRHCWLPEGEWVLLWSGEAYAAGENTVPAPMGKPPVFYRAGSPYAALFREIAAI